MRSYFRRRLLIGCALVALTVSSSAWAGPPWRSSLYPETWTPGYRDDAGRFLQDFSYAGYHRGEQPLPPIDDTSKIVIDVTKPPFLADPSGASDSTKAIREAIETVGKFGGGVVHLPEGTYLVSPQTDEEKAALYLDRPGVTLRGEGPDKTFVFNTETSMRVKNVIRMAPHEIRDQDFSWRHNVGQASVPLSADAKEMDTVLWIDGGDYTTGDWVVVLSDATDDFIADHNMTGVWTSQGVGGVTFYRKVVAVDRTAGTITVDIPIRYPLLRRDNARVARTLPHIEGVAVESLSIGMKEITYGSMGDDDWDTPGTGAYDAHASTLVEVNHVVNGWIRNVRSFRHWENNDYHFLSSGIRTRFARSITVTDVDLQNSQYHGAGGNGYHFSIQGSDSLLTSCSSSNARHNYTIALIAATGNVIHDSTSFNGRFPVDFHMHLSPANLIDSMVLDEDGIEAANRFHGDHGFGTTQSVLWNTRGDTEGWQVDLGFKKLIRSAQFGWGYVIGTSGNDNAVERPGHDQALPDDFLEGRGSGADLVPQSLYESQLQRRLSARAPRQSRTPRRIQP
jgi:hypothetical protein